MAYGNQYLLAWLWVTAYLGQDKSPETRCDKDDRPTRSATLLCQEAEQVVGMSKQCLDGGMIENLRVPAVCIYPGIRNSSRQHVVITQPVYGRTSVLFVENPCSRRFGIQAMDGDDADQISAIFL